MLPSFTSGSEFPAHFGCDGCILVVFELSCVRGNIPIVPLMC